jgi:hypothetical protein
MPRASSARPRLAAPPPRSGRRSPSRGAPAPASCHGSPSSPPPRTHAIAKSTPQFISTQRAASKSGSYVDPYAPYASSSSGRGPPGPPAPENLRTGSPTPSAARSTSRAHRPAARPARRARVDLALARRRPARRRSCAPANRPTPRAPAPLLAHGSGFSPTAIPAIACVCAARRRGPAGRRRGSAPRRQVEDPEPRHPAVALDQRQVPRERRDLGDRHARSLRHQRPPARGRGSDSGAMITRKNGAPWFVRT